jgi:Flp pilus assembly pilin Flp
VNAKRQIANFALRDMFAGFREEEAGSTAIEYGLVVAFVVAVIIVTLVQVRENLLALPFPRLIAAFSDALS